MQVLESYDRAYSNMVRVQQLSELEEVCVFMNQPQLAHLMSLYFWVLVELISPLTIYLV